MAKQLTLGKNERLKSRKLMETLFKQGKSFALPPFRVYHYNRSAFATAPLQFGVGVSSRHFKKAVDRNRIKRLIREAWRLQKPIPDPNNPPLQVFIIYTGKELPDFAEVSKRMQQVVARIEQLYQTKQP